MQARMQFCSLQPGMLLAVSGCLMSPRVLAAELSPALTLTEGYSFPVKAYQDLVLPLPFYIPGDFRVVSFGGK